MLRISVLVAGPVKLEYDPTAQAVQFVDPVKITMQEAISRFTVAITL